jgi:hypothetical protein
VEAGTASALPIGFKYPAHECASYSTQLTLAS